MRKKRIRWLAAFVLALMLIAGCGGGTNQPALSPQNGTDNPSQPTNTTPAASQDQTGGAASGNSNPTGSPGTSDQVAVADPSSRGTNPDDSVGIKPRKIPYATGKPSTPPPPSSPEVPFASLEAAERAWLAMSRQQLGPEVAVKGIYVSGAVAATPRLFDNLVALVERTELNAMVVDIKSDWGSLTFRSTNPVAIALGEQGSGIKDLRAFVQRLHEKNIYVIGRLVTFKDDRMAKSRPEWMLKRTDGSVWHGYGKPGPSWIDPTNKEAWRYLVSVGKEAAAAGFDEIQFDYVRFPSDGPMDQLVPPDMGGRSKAQVIGEFLAYAREELRPYGVRVSADVFGLVTSVKDDMGIGQHLETVSPGLDYVSPMTYPSHYSRGNLGVQWPNNDPYAILKRSLDDAIGRLRAAGLTHVKVRPWLQDFTYGYPDNPPVTYGPEQVRAQIQATYDAGSDTWLLWNAANKYTEGALKPE
jgi:hypothetical protein